MKSSELGMIVDEKPFHIRYMERKIQELDKLQKSGNRYTEVDIESLLALSLENLHLHHRLDMLEKMIANGYNMYCYTQWPAKQKVVEP